MRLVLQIVSWAALAVTALAPVLYAAGQVGLEQSLVKYERGSFLIQHCRTVLAQAEKQIELLSKSPDGGLAVEPLDDAAEADEP